MQRRTLALFILVASAGLLSFAACGGSDTNGGGGGGGGGGGNGDGGTTGDDGSGGGGGDDGGGGGDDAQANPDAPGGGNFPAGTICNDSATPRTPPAKMKHVLIIIFENKDYGEVMDSANAPYMNSIKAKCGYSTKYLDNVFSVDIDSEPHYLTLTSGSNCNTGLQTTGTGCITDDKDPSNHTLSTTSIMQQVPSYKAYIESMTSACDANTSGEYATKHNPPPYYTAIAGSCAGSDVGIAAVSCPNTKNATCGTPNNVLTQDLANDKLAAYLWVTPNLTNDMHDGTVTQGDNWLHTYLPLILASPAYLRGEMAIQILWDEQDHFNGGPIPNLFVSPYTKPTASNTTFNHFSALRTAEEQLGITTFLGCASGTPPGGSGTCPTGSTTSLRSTFNF